MHRPPTTRRSAAPEAPISQADRDGRRRRHAGLSGLGAGARVRRSPSAAASADQPPVAETLARYAASLSYEDLPPEVVRETKRYLID